jgi:hypothetical protein
MNAIEPSGHVVLRGIRIEIGSDVGAAFCLDVCRHLDDLLSAGQLRAKYGLVDEAAWQALAENEPLQRAIAAAKTRRIHDGSAARERAAHLFVEAPNVLGTIMSDAAANPRHRIEAAKEMRQIAIPGSDKPADQRERFVIHINFGTQKVHRDIELTPVKQEIECEDDLPAPRATGIANYNTNRE